MHLYIIQVIHEDTRKIRVHCLKFHYSHIRIKILGACVTGMFIVHAYNDFILQILSCYLKQSYKLKENKFYILCRCQCDTLIKLWILYSTNYILSNKSTVITLWSGQLYYSTYCRAQSNIPNPPTPPPQPHPPSPTPHPTPPTHSHTHSHKHHHHHHTPPHTPPPLRW